MSRKSRPTSPLQLLAVGSAIAASVAAFFLADESTASPLPAGMIALLMAVTAMTILASIRAPRTAAALAIVTFSIGTALEGTVTSYLVAVLVTLFSVAFQSDRRTSIVWGAVALAATSPVLLIFLPDEWNDLRAVLQLVAFIGFAVAAGDAARSRGAVIESLKERMRRAQQTAEAGAQRRVAEERVRIARDLHDVMAHQIAIINLHASVASRALRNRPEDAQQSLSTIRDAARTILNEISSLLTVLRADDPDASGIPIGVGILDGLIGEFTATGLAVEVREVGERTTLSAPSDVVAYRVVQEALTNAQKHGSDSTALLLLRWSHEGVEINVSNSLTMEANQTASASAGYGLVGVRERMLSVGGTAVVRVGPGPVHRFSAFVPTGIVDAPDSEGGDPTSLTSAGPSRESR